jgi:hypothetical protein
MISFLTFESTAASSIDWNNSDTGIIIALAVFALIGLLFGANRLGGQIVGQFVAVLGGLALANIILPKFISMDWYQQVIKALWNNAQLVSWLFYILLSAAGYLILSLLWRLLVLKLIDASKKTPVLSRILGLVLGVLDWAILLVAACMLFAALPGWLGTNAPDWVKQADDYLTNSVIAGKLIPLFKQLLAYLGIAGTIGPAA